ncbi:FkbM family methyltransferase [Scytonema sp. PRP1]|uniref:FkbM family methyltransferase n=1 Tax=Scytonema sp. PRP1 TaxID=3120513 RepID=UPI002FD6C11B
MNLLTVISRKIGTLKKMFRLTGIKGILILRPLPNFLLAILSKMGIHLKDKPIKLQIKGYPHPIYMRYGSSDPAIFYQIFIFREYSCIDDLTEAKIIIDAGANVGYSSIYFLKKYPNAQIIAVEPDHENFNICQKNLSGYKERVSVIQSGIWSHRTALKVCNEDSREKCSIQVKECQEGESPDIYAIDIDTLLKKYNLTTIDLLKIDIEGSESVIFSKNYQNWLEKVKNIVIELHGTECEQEFFKALSVYDYDLSTYGELTICQKLSSQTAKACR